MIFNEVTSEHRRRLGNALLELFDLAFLPLVMFFALCSSCLGVIVTFPIKPLNWSSSAILRKESSFQYSITVDKRGNVKRVFTWNLPNKDIKITKVMLAIRVLETQQSRNLNEMYLRWRCKARNQRGRAASTLGCFSKTPFFGNSRCAKWIFGPWVNRN